MMMRAIGPFTSRPIGSWTLEHDVSGWPNGTDELSFFDAGSNSRGYVLEFDIAGDESLSVTWSGEQCGDSVGSATVLHSPEEDWDTLPGARSAGSWCYSSENLLSGWVTPPDYDWSFCSGWTVLYNICRLR